MTDRYAWCIIIMHSFNFYGVLINASVVREMMVYEFSVQIKQFSERLVKGKYLFVPQR